MLPKMWQDEKQTSIFNVLDTGVVILSDLFFI